MTETIKFNEKYIDADGVYDFTLGKTQQAINNAGWIDMTVTPGTVTPICAKYKKIGSTYILWIRFNAQTATNIGEILCTVSWPIALPYTPMRVVIVGDIGSSGRVGVNLDCHQDGTIKYYPGIYNQYTGTYQSYLYGDAYIII